MMGLGRTTFGKARNGHPSGTSDGRLIDARSSDNHKSSAPGAERRRGMPEWRGRGGVATGDEENRRSRYRDLDNFSRAKITNRL